MGVRKIAVHQDHPDRDTSGVAADISTGEAGLPNEMMSGELVEIFVNVEIANIGFKYNLLTPEPYKEKK